MCAQLLFGLIFYFPPVSIVLFMKIRPVCDQSIHCINIMYTMSNIFNLNNACGICTLSRALRLWISYTCRFYSFVCYSCVAPTFSFEWNKEVVDVFKNCVVTLGDPLETHLPYPAHTNHTHTHTRTPARTHARTCTHARTHALTYTHIHCVARACTHTYTRTHTITHAHTHTHTHTDSNARTHAGTLILSLSLRDTI